MVTVADRVVWAVCWRDEGQGKRPGDVLGNWEMLEDAIIPSKTSFELYRSCWKFKISFRKVRAGCWGFVYKRNPGKT